MVDVTLPNGQTLSMPSVTDEEKAKRIAANYYKKNKDLQPVQETLNESEPEIDRSGVGATLPFEDSLLVQIIMKNMNFVYGILVLLLTCI